MRIALACIAALLWILLTSRVQNLGPQDMVQTDAGDIHRHDFVTQFGWPTTCAQQYVVNWYVHRPSGVTDATHEQRELWNRERTAAIEEIPEHERGRNIRADFDRYRAIAEGRFWSIHWRGLLLVLAIWIIMIQLFTVGGRLLHSGWKSRRRREGHCLVCGYDLRATPDRCPECGVSVDGQAV